MVVKLSKANQENNKNMRPWSPVMGKILGKCSKLSNKLLFIKCTLATAKDISEKCSNLHGKGSLLH